MDKTSKRDIYDLIAELAKSTNMNLDGTEFVPEPVDVRRKAIAPEQEKETPNDVDNLIHLEPALKEQAMNSETDMLHEIQLAKMASMEELNRMKAAALEELKQARAALVTELNGNVGFAKEVTSVNGAANNGSPNSYESTSTSVAQQIPKQPIHLTAQNNKASVTQTQAIHDLNESEETDFFETVSVDELNRITSEAVREDSEVVVDKTAVIEPMLKTQQEVRVQQELIHEQLKSISEKIDQLSPRILKTEIVNELKLSDERIVQTVNKSKENLLDELSDRFVHLKPVNNHSIMKWLGVLNLMLLLLVLAYLLFQKNSVIGSIQKTEQSIKPETPQNTNDKAVQPEPSELTNSNQPNASESQSPEIEQEAPSVVSTPASVQSVATSTKSLKSGSNTASSQYSQTVIQQRVVSPSTSMASSSPVVKKDIDPGQGDGNLKPIKKNTTELKPSMEVSKKSTPNQDVYFGED